MQLIIFLALIFLPSIIEWIIAEDKQWQERQRQIKLEADQAESEAAAAWKREFIYQQNLERMRRS